MFNIGDYIVYGSTGVCKVVEIKKLDNIKGANVKAMYYVLNPLYQSSTIYTPVENPKVFMRPVITKEQAEKFINTIPEIHAEAYHNPNIQKLVEHYELSIQSYNCADLIELAMSLFAKKKKADELNKKFGQVDERFMKRAEDLLYGEFSVALDMPKEQVQKYIEDRVAVIRDDTDAEQEN